jgi:membrane-bound ClpP family serine protease
VRVDPVIALMDEIEQAYMALAEARNDDDVRAIRCGLARIAMLHQRLIATEPTTVIGAACLLREAASLLPQSQVSSCNDKLREIAADFDEGRRRVEDLVWLRRAAEALSAGAPNDLNCTAAQMIRLALKGASRPVLLYRGVTPLANHSKLRPRNSPAITSIS